MGSVSAKSPVIVTATCCGSVLLDKVHPAFTSIRTIDVSCPGSIRKDSLMVIIRLLLSSEQRRATARQTKWLAYRESKETVRFEGKYCLTTVVHHSGPANNVSVVSLNSVDARVTLTNSVRKNKSEEVEDEK